MTDSPPNKKDGPMSVFFICFNIAGACRPNVRREAASCRGTPACGKRQTISVKFQSVALICQEKAGACRPNVRREAASCRGLYVDGSQLYSVYRRVKNAERERIKILSLSAFNYRTDIYQRLRDTAFYSLTIRFRSDIINDRRYIGEFYAPLSESSIG